MTLTQAETTPMVIGAGRPFASDGAVIDAVNPATGEVIGRVPDASAADAALAVSTAAEAFRSWRALDPQQWRDSLLALAATVEAHGDELATLDVMDNGSPIREMRNDVRFAVECLRYYASLVMQTSGATIPTSHDRLDYTLRQPYGVVVRIIPFNHPLLFAASRIGAPLAAGNTVIIKPSEHTSLSALRIGELAQSVLPPGVVNVVTGHGASAGDALVTNPQVRRISFTGAAETGRRIIARSASVNLKSVTLELGGKNPLVVFPDADLDKALEAAVRGMNFTWQGQSCGSTSRLIVHADVYGELVERLAVRVSQIISGDPLDPATDTGALVNQAQLDKVTSFIGIGKSGGARLVAGGDQLESGDFGRGLFVRPTVFADVDPDSRLAQEEIFGPVLATMPFADYEDAVRIANGTRYGLTASVFTSDLATAHRYARDVEAGYVWVNEVSRHVPATPFGGWKDSGLGREEDASEVDSYTQVKNVHVNFES
jgi:acyl-CoA reductase-like NAD-dependent aldehyde dehydrogenase